MEMKEFRSLLLSAVGKSGRTQADISRAIGKNSKFLSQIINGRQNMKVSDMLLFCEATGISERDLFDTDMSPQMLKLVMEIRQMDENDQVAIAEMAKILKNRRKE